jgi:hypothetical protein
MESILRIKIAPFLAVFLLSGCSFFGDAVENCEEPQEYQESVSVPPLIVPSYLRNVQDRSIFNIPDIQESNAVTQKSFVVPEALDTNLALDNQRNQMGYIQGDELSELLQLIDQTISNRQLQGQYEPIYQNETVDYEAGSVVKPCLEGPPKYFSETISPRSMPSQTSTKTSRSSEIQEEEKSRRQMRIEARKKQRIIKQQEKDEQDDSSMDKEESLNQQENKLESIFKSITTAVTYIYTGGTVSGVSVVGGQSIVPPKPIEPNDGEKIDESDERLLRVEGKRLQSIADRDLAERVRNLAVSDPSLNEEQRVLIRNMSDEQILEMISVIRNQSRNEETEETTKSDPEIVDELATQNEDENWFTRAKDQWTEGKAQREARREERQKRRTERQSQDN